MRNLFRSRNFSNHNDYFKTFLPTDTLSPKFSFYKFAFQIFELKIGKCTILVRKFNKPWNGRIFDNNDIIQSLFSILNTARILHTNSHTYAKCLETGEFKISNYVQLRKILFIEQSDRNLYEVFLRLKSWNRKCAKFSDIKLDFTHNYFDLTRDFNAGIANMAFDTKHFVHTRTMMMMIHVPSKICYWG